MFLPAMRACCNAVTAALSWGHYMPRIPAHISSRVNQVFRRITMNIRSRSDHRCLELILLVVICLASAQILSAQATDSILLGVVTDPSEAVVPNATVIATNRATGVKYTARTNVTGEYRINNVPVGTYDIEASANGMATKKVSGVALDLNRTSSVNFRLEVEAVSTSVQVVESTALIDTSTAQLQTTFNSEA